MLVTAIGYIHLKFCWLIVLKSPFDPGPPMLPSDTRAAIGNAFVPDKMAFALFKSGKL